MHIGEMALSKVLTYLRPFHLQAVAIKNNNGYLMCLRNKPAPT